MLTRVVQLKSAVLPQKRLRSLKLRSYSTEAAEGELSATQKVCFDLFLSYTFHTLDPPIVLIQTQRHLAFFGSIFPSQNPQFLTGQQTPLTNLTL